jgi:hypothetical protein
VTGPVRDATELAAATAADRRAQLSEGLTAVDCLRCGACALVRKNSLAQTSIQWTTDAVHRCQFYAASTGCAELHRSIDAAVAAGQLRIRNG